MPICHCVTGGWIIISNRSGWCCGYPNDHNRSRFVVFQFILLSQSLFCFSFLSELCSFLLQWINWRPPSYMKDNDEWDQYVPNWLTARSLFQCWRFSHTSQVCSTHSFESETNRIKNLLEIFHQQLSSLLHRHM